MCLKFLPRKGNLVKFIVVTGSEDHTTSSASCQAKFVGGPYDGQHLYQQKQFQIKADWDHNNDNHKRWVTTEYSLPEGTQVSVIGKGRTGPRGVNKHEFQRIYRLDGSAEVLEETVDTGLRDCLCKGRMVLVRDRIAERTKVNTEEGF
jgi:hypothetical protein